MSLAPSTYHYRPKGRSPEAVTAEARLVARIREICAEFPRCGYRRVAAQLKAEGERVNHKRIARIVREQDLRVRPKRRFVVTTDSDHDGPIFPDLAKDLAPTGPDQLPRAPLAPAAPQADRPQGPASSTWPWSWTLDAWSRRVVGWALAALAAAIAGPEPPPGCVHHGDRSKTASSTAARLRAVPEQARGARAPRFDGAPGQPARQRQGRELHEDAQA